MPEAWPVVDLFSGAGGMSCGFQRHPDFTVVGAADAQIGKPSTGLGALGCNASYAASIGLDPVCADLGVSDPADVCVAMGLGAIRPTVLTACPPCTGFTRTTASNHLRDDRRNGLVGRVAGFAALLRPDIILVENARELVMGRFAAHLHRLAGELSRLGYQTMARTYFLDAFGLPQRRERAIVVAVRRSLPALELGALWAGWRLDAKATHVRRAISKPSAVPRIASRRARAGSESGAR
jgi:DNA (cytosine-5)-methyltransferase 1